jgi:arylsulfatase A-like enzyme
MKSLLQNSLTIAFLLASSMTAVYSDQTKPPWSVMLITVDNLRPDHMSLYGYEKDTTPYLNKFAKESIIFNNAFSTSAWTAPGMVSIFTGYYPPVHAQHGRFSFYDEEMTSAFRTLADQGYEILGEAIDGASHGGFGFQERLGIWWKKEPLLESFIEDRMGNEAPFFAWAHLTDVHLPYTTSEENAKRFGASDRTNKAIDAVGKYRVILRNPEEVDVKLNHPGKVEFSEKDIPIVRALYDGEVADVDERLRKSLERMRETGLLDHTIVIIAADHGEELFDHGWLGHASTGYDGKLYDELIRIPMIIHLPDQSLTGQFSAMVQGVDVMPTVFDLLGIDSKNMQPQMQGQSFLPIVKGEKDKIRDYVFNQTTFKGWTTPKEEMTSRIVSVRSVDKKLIWIPTKEGTRVEAYDLQQDPGELTNIYPARKKEFQALEKARDEWTADNQSRSATLVQSAAEKRIENIAKAVLGDTGVTGAIENWTAIQTMEETWRLEPNNFFQLESNTTHWQKIKHEAERMVGEAMICQSKGKVVRTKNSTQPRDVDSWYCDL